MGLRSTTTLPPGGWRYIQKETGFKVAEMGPFNDAVKMIVMHRHGNNLPGATMAEAATDLDTYTCERLGNDPNWCQNGQKKTPTPVPSQAEPGAKPVGQLSRLVDGAKILQEWLGNGGKPVEPELAEARAAVCVGQCSDPAKGFNKPPGMFGKMITGPVAQKILEHMREKQNLALTVKDESKLHTCTICMCHLPLKVWVPMDDIMKRTEASTLDQFPSFCWMVTENRRNNKTLPTTTDKNEPTTDSSSVS